MANAQPALAAGDDGTPVKPFCWEQKEHYDGNGRHLSERITRGDPPKGFPRFVGHGMVQVKGVAMTNGQPVEQMRQFPVQFGIEASGVLEAFAAFEETAAEKMPIAQQKILEELNAKKIVVPGAEPTEALRKMQMGDA